MGLCGGVRRVPGRVPEGSRRGPGELWHLGSVLGGVRGEAWAGLRPDPGPPGGSQARLGGSRGLPGASLGAPKGVQEASRRHPRGSREASELQTRIRSPKLSQQTSKRDPRGVQKCQFCVGVVQISAFSLFRFRDPFRSLSGSVWEAILEPSWPPEGLLGGSWAVLGASWAVLGASWAVLAGSWQP